LAQMSPAGDPPGPTNPPAAKDSRSSLPESVRRVERQTGGEVLRAEPMQRDGREVYRLKVLTSDGRVRVMQEDPSDPPKQDRSRDRRNDQGKDRPARGRDKQKESSRSDEDPPQ
jgi:hypothetical protein